MGAADEANHHALEDGQCGVGGGDFEDDMIVEGNPQPFETPVKD